MHIHSRCRSRLLLSMMPSPFPLSQYIIQFFFIASEGDICYASWAFEEKFLFRSFILKLLQMKTPLSSETRLLLCVGSAHELQHLEFLSSNLLRYHLSFIKSKSPVNSNSLPSSFSLRFVYGWFKQHLSIFTSFGASSPHEVRRQGRWGKIT